MKVYSHGKDGVSTEMGLHSTAQHSTADFEPSIPLVHVSATAHKMKERSFETQNSFPSSCPVSAKLLFGKDAVDV